MKQAQQWERFPEDMKNLIGRKKIRRQSHLKPLTLSFFTCCSIVLRITRAINGFTPNLLIAIKCQKRANWGVIWLLDFLLFSFSGIVKKYSRGKYDGCSRKWGLPRGFSDKRHRSKIAKNVETILYQNTDSRQKLTEKSDNLQFATATIHC